MQVIHNNLYNGKRTLGHLKIDEPAVSSGTKAPPQVVTWRAPIQAHCNAMTQAMAISIRLQTCLRLERKGGYS